MKKLIALLLALLLCLGTAMAEPVKSEESATLTYEELEIYLARLAKEVLAVKEATTATDDAGNTSVSFPGGVMHIADEALSETTAILGADLEVGAACPRGLKVGDTLAMLLETYPNDNPFLFGTYYDAALYTADEKPEAKAGWVLRDGQRVQEVVHAVYHWTEDGVISCGVSYTLDRDTIVGISVFGMENLVDEETALTSLNNVAAMQENSEYFAYPTSLDGSTLAPFEREDLSFAGLDILDLTVEMATEALGSAPVDEWTEDNTGDQRQYLRLKQWEDVSILFLYDANKEFLRMDSITINGDSIEGPRGVRVGDLMDSVMYRFRHSEGSALENGIALYGDGQAAPYGVLSYGETTATITYTLALEDEQTVIWHLTFAEGELQSMNMLLR